MQSTSPLVLITHLKFILQPETSLDRDLRSQLDGMLFFNGAHIQALPSRPTERYHSIFKLYRLLFSGRRRIRSMAETSRAAVLTHHQCAGRWKLPEGLALAEGGHRSRNPRTQMSYCSPVLRAMFLNHRNERTLIAKILMQFFHLSFKLIFEDRRNDLVDNGFISKLSCYSVCQSKHLPRREWVLHNYLITSRT